MAHGYTDLDGLKMAVEMEKRGAKLYRHAIKLSVHPDVTALLSRLERDELHHQATFAEHYNRRARELGDGAAYDAESGAFLSAVAADVVFPDGLLGMALNQTLDSVRSVLDEAIQAERDSIGFYEDMAQNTLDPLSRQVFLDIALDERVHLKELIDLRTEEDA